MKVEGMIHRREFKDGTVIRTLIEKEPSFTFRRADELLTKEPETIQWLNKMNEDDVLWDVGACVGSYSIYAAKRYNVRVIAFEPSWSNLIALESNILLNKINDLITVYPIAIGRKHHYDYLLVNRPGVIGSSANDVMSSKYAVNHNRKKSGCVIDSINNLVNKGLPFPTHIKVDVDGTEPDVIMGALKVLPNIKSILIELQASGKGRWDSKTIKTHMKIVDKIKSLGLKLDEDLYEMSAKRHDKSMKWRGQRNYIFYGDGYEV